MRSSEKDVVKATEHETLLQQIGAVNEEREWLNWQDKLEFRRLDSQPKTLVLLSEFSHSCTRDCLCMEYSVYNGCDFSMLTDESLLCSREGQ